MNLRINLSNLVTLFLLVTAVLGGAACTQKTEGSGVPLILGLDHIPVAVNDLDVAAERYRQLGFVLKPGRVHENGIQNQHVKFPDGTEIELITASEARDSLTAEYLRFLAAGDGAAFVGFYAPEVDRLANRFDDDGRAYRREGGLLTFTESEELRYIFFGHRVRSPTDQPEHFEHANGANALIGVWIAGDDLEGEGQLLAELGATISEEEVHVPGKTRAMVARLDGAEVVFLPAPRQLVPVRRILGLTVRTDDLDATRRSLSGSSLELPLVLETVNGQSIFIPPDIAHGVWLEFRQDGDG